MGSEHFMKTIKTNIKSIIFGVIYIFITLTFIQVTRFIISWVVANQIDISLANPYLFLAITIIIGAVFPLLTVAFISFDHLKKIIFDKNAKIYFVPTKFITFLIIFHILFPWFLSLQTAFFWFGRVTANAYPRFIMYALLWYNLFYSWERRNTLFHIQYSDEDEGGEIRISPLREGSGLLGIGVNSKLSTEKFSEYKREDLEKENKTFGH